MTIFDSIIQGIVQGLTEFLPVSSSGHLSIAQYFLGIKENNLLFNVALHVGTLFSVIFVYYKLLIKLFMSFFTLLPKIFSKKSKNKYETIVLNFIFSLFPLFLLFVPLPKIKNLKTFASFLASTNNISIVGISLIITSALLTFSTLYYGKISRKKHFSFMKISEMKPINSFLIGVAQLVAAIFPGLSRSGSTVSVALFQGIKREDALDFSFIMGTPTIVAASILELKEAREQGINIDWNIIFVGIVVSAIVGFLSIKLFKWFVSKDKTWIFALYSLIIGVSILVIGMFK